MSERKHRVLASGLLAALVLMTLLAARTAGAADTARLTVMARIATYFRMQIEHQVTALTVTASDIERGYVDVPAASIFSVVTNTQDGLVIDFRPRGAIFLAAVVTGLQSPVTIGAQGGSVLRNSPHGRTIFHQLGYRFVLRPELQPGNYAWPLQISVRAA